MKWKRWEIALAGAVLAAFLLSAVPAREQEDLAGKMVRLHVLARSDSFGDQMRKLRVRDAVLEASRGETVLDDALLNKLRRAAQDVLREEGCEDAVTVSRERCWFETREYPDFSLPAGEYDAVRVVIGSGAGHNWWCVIYPPLCAGTCEADVAEIAEHAGLTREEIGLICGEEGYILRFKLVEWWNRLRHELQF